jgi:hypothetical protein
VTVDARLAATDAGRLNDALVERLGRHRDGAIMREKLTTAFNQQEDERLRPAI